jgi:2'-5' RNA ligase
MYRSWHWTTEENLHITIAFLGDIDDRGLDLLGEVVSAATEDAAAIPFDTGSVVTLPPGPMRRAKVLALEIAKGKNHMASLAAKIEACLAAAGNREGYPFRPAERRVYTPHITLARKGRRPASGFSLREELGETPLELNLQGLADRVVIYKSELRPYNSGGHGGGHKYTPLTIYNLL